MKVTTTVVTALIVALLAMADSAQAGFIWKNLSVDPYAHTRAEAMRGREAAFKALGLSAAQIAAAKTATDGRGVHLEIKKGDRLVAMVSKNGVVHEDVTVGFGHADTEEWYVQAEGKSFVVVLPPCHNWSLRSRPVALANGAPTSSGCKEIRFTTKAGEPAVVIGFVASGALSLDNPCIAKNAALRACPSGDKQCDFSRAAAVIDRDFVPGNARAYPTTPGEHTLYVPASFAGLDSRVLTCMRLVRSPMPDWDWSKPYPGPKTAMRHNKAAAKWMATSYSDTICVDPPAYGWRNFARVYHSREEVPATTRFKVYFPPVGTSLFEDN